MFGENLGRIQFEKNIHGFSKTLNYFGSLSKGFLKFGEHLMQVSASIHLTLKSPIPFEICSYHLALNNHQQQKLAYRFTRFRTSNFLLLTFIHLFRARKKNSKHLEPKR